ncbi:MAG: DNA-processing protein DprA [Oscillospiraceae bacterium]|nr:DNA-processing protein DprA [Oscillospiraceae bacterium]
MTGPERGYLLLCAELGDGKKPLTLPQLRTLAERIRLLSPARPDPDRSVQLQDLRELGYDADFSARVVELLEREQALTEYLSVGTELGISPLTCISPDYPARLRRLGARAPAVLFCRGDVALLKRPTVALVGSRELSAAGEAFARRVGVLAAQEGFTLISGNAHGADQVAQDACLEAGGTVIAILPESLSEHPPRNSRMLCLCESGWHLPMTAYRALDRNRLIHTLGEKCFVAQSRCSGGTWRGSEENLRRGWSPLFVHDDGSPGCRALISMGGVGVRLESLHTLQGLSAAQLPLGAFWEEPT